MIGSFSGRFTDGRLLLEHDAELQRPLGTVCALTGFVKNADTLASDLGLGSIHQVADVIAAGYERWGVDVFARLRGRFAVAVWNEMERQGAVAIDQLGAGGLFYVDVGGTELVFATEPRAVYDNASFSPTPDELGVAQWIADGAFEPGRTLYRDVRRLGGGCVIELRDRRWTIRPYWTPRYSEPEGGSREELAAHLRTQIRDAVARDMRAPAFAGTLLSGGLDSSTVAATVAGVGRSAAYSMTFPSHLSADESEYIDLLTKRLQIPSRRAVMSAGSLLRPSLEFLSRWQWPSISPALLQNFAVAHIAKEDGVDVLFDGEGGDELFGAPAYLVADALAKGRVFLALRLAEQLAEMGERPPSRLVRWLVREYGVKGALSRRVLTTVRHVRGGRAYAQPWLSEHAQRLLEPADSTWNWKNGRDGPRWWAARVDQLTTWRERIGAHDYFRRKALMVGVRDAHPFLDDLDLAEFVLRLPPQSAFSSSFSRPLLREAMNGLLPDEIRLRPHKTSFNEFIGACLDGGDRAVIGELLGDDAEVKAYVRLDFIRDVYLRPPAHERPLDWSGVLWRLASLECWLRTLADPSFPERMLHRPDLLEGLRARPSQRVRSF